MSNVKIDSAELARLRGIAADHETLVRQSAGAYRLPAGVSGLVSKLTKIASPTTTADTTAGTPTPDGKGWQVSFDLMTLLIQPYQDEIQLADNKQEGALPIKGWKLNVRGELDADAQTAIIGYAERIVRNNTDGDSDPVVEGLSLTGYVAPRAAGMA